MSNSGVVCKSHPDFFAQAEKGFPLFADNLILVRCWKYFVEE